MCRVNETQMTEWSHNNYFFMKRKVSSSFNVRIWESLLTNVHHHHPFLSFLLHANVNRITGIWMFNWNFICICGPCGQMVECARKNEVSGQISSKFMFIRHFVFLVFFVLFFGLLTSTMIMSQQLCVTNILCRKMSVFLDSCVYEWVHCTGDPSFKKKKYPQSSWICKLSALFFSLYWKLWLCLFLFILFQLVKKQLDDKFLKIWQFDNLWSVFVDFNLFCLMQKLFFQILFLKFFKKTR